MNIIKYAVASAGLAGTLLLGAAPVAAQTAVNVGDGSATATDNTVVNVDRSRTVNGDCSAILEQDVDQDQNNNTTQTNSGGNVGTNVGGLQDDTTQNQSNDQSTSQSNSSSNSQSNSQSFSADCSVTNVTNVAAAQAA